LTRSAGAPVATIRSISTLQKRRLIRSPKKTTIAVPTAEVGLAARSRARSPLDPAIAYCQGTPLRNEIEMRRTADLAEATGVCADAIAGRFGAQAVDGKIQAHIIAIEA
jgi:hypothetical protein